MKLILRFIVAFSSFTSFLPKLYAQANPLTGAFRTSKTDAAIAIQQDIFFLRRTYDSRSLHDGLFGFGWCSDFEKRMDLRRSDQITLYDCRFPREIVFKKNKAGVFERSDQAFPTVAQVLERSGAEYILRSRDYESSFNTKGQLSEISRNLKRIKILYDSSGLLEKIQLSPLHELKIRFDPGRRYISQISGPQKLKINYKYENKKLIEVAYDSEKTQFYAYDSYENLIQVQTSGQTPTILEYDTREDRISKIRTGDLCEETLQYKRNSTFEFTTVTTKKCSQRPPVTSRYKFRIK